MAHAQPANYAASVMLTSAAAEDFNDLLPRILDLSVQRRASGPRYEVLCLSLARAGWRDWPEPLVASIVQVFAAALEKAIVEFDGRWVDELICGLALAGLDLAPFLARLEQADATKALVKFYQCNSHSLMQGRLGNAFWRGQGAKVIAWFASPAVVAAINRYDGLAA